MESFRGMHLPSVRKNYIEIFQTLQAYQAAINEAAIVSITDLRGNIIYVNQMFVGISKYSEEELLGKNHRVINSGFHGKDFFRNMWQDIGAGKSWRGEIKNRAKDGSYYWVDTVITPIVDRKGNIFQYLSIRNLITPQKENEEKLIRIQHEIRKREQQLKDAQEVAKTGSWHLAIPGNLLEWSEETYNIFEIPVETTVTYDFFLAKVHPEDRKMVDKNWHSALKTGIYEIEHRIITKSGEKWVSERARFEFDKSTALKAALGTVQDITEKKITEHILVESKDLYKNLFNNSPFAIGILDKITLRFLKVNKTARELYGYTRPEFLRLTAYDIRIPEDHEGFRNLIASGTYARNKTVRTHRKKNGELMQIEPSIKEIKYKGRDAYLITISDMTEKLKIQYELNQAKLNTQKAIIEAQEASRAQIGMELHDNVNQLLVASTLYLKAVHGSSDKDREFLETSRNIIANANEEIRKLSASLVSPTLNDVSLKESIECFSEGLAVSNMKFELDLRINETLIAEGLKTNVFRIIQEQTNNIIKYAESTKVKIALIQTGNLLTLEISDNGKGFDPNEKAKGIGLTNIFYRAETYNGKAFIETGPGKGCKILVEFLLSPDVS